MVADLQGPNSKAALQFRTRGVDVVDDLQGLELLSMWEDGEKPAPQ
jgi:hypothetical protein